MTTDGTGGVTGAEACDPDTGICGPTAQASSGGVVATGAQVGAIIPTTLDQDSGWGAQQTLMLAVALFTLGLVFVPAFAWRRMAQRPASQATVVHQPADQDRVSA